MTGGEDVVTGVAAGAPRGRTGAAGARAARSVGQGHRVRGDGGVVPDLGRGGVGRGVVVAAARSGVIPGAGSRGCGGHRVAVVGNGLVGGAAVAPLLDGGRLDAAAGEVGEVAALVGVPLGERQVGLQVEGDQLGDRLDAVEVGALVAVARVDAEADQRRADLEAGLDGAGRVGAVVPEGVAGVADAVLGREARAGAG